MIRINLTNRGFSQDIEAQVSKLWPFSVDFLLLCLILQIFSFGFRYYKHSQYLSELKPLKLKLSKLQKNMPTLATDTAILSASIAEWNQWTKAQATSPLKYIYRMETNKPPGIEIQKFHISNNSGQVLMLAPDMNYSARFTNTVFRGLNGSLNLIEKTIEGFIIQYQWTE